MKTKKVVLVSDFVVGEFLLEVRHYAGAKHEFRHKVTKVTPTLIFIGSRKISRKPINICSTDYFFEVGNDFRVQKITA